MEMDRVIEKWGTSDLVEVHAALLLDPDDAVTTQFPNNEVEHDVLAEYNAGVLSSTTTMVAIVNPVEWINFEDKEDVITARNMRWNTVATTASFDDAYVECTIYYTLERIQDAQIMELLDIL